MITVQMGKLGLKEVKWLVSGHLAVRDQTEPGFRLRFI